MNIEYYQKFLLNLKFIYLFQFNFVGKLLGPKGNSLKRIQEDTLTKMAVLGRGSMRDKDKEEDLRASGDPKYGHLQVDKQIDRGSMRDKDKEEDLRASGDPKYGHLQVDKQMGRGSMRDKDKEEDLRASGDPKYGHLQVDR